MQDSLADMPTQKLIEKTVAGETAWSEMTLGSILDTNAEAIRTMQRATKLPECDWGSSTVVDREPRRFSLFEHAHCQD